MKKKHLLCIASVMLVGALSLTACSGQGAAPSITVQNVTGESNLISVYSKEKVNVVPDVADISLGIKTENEDASLCQQQNDEIVAKVLEVLTGMGIEEKSIQTSDFYLNPRYSWTNNVQTLIGYEMSTTLTLTAVALDQVGTVLSLAVEAGVNDVGSVTYKSSQYDQSYQEALRLAIESAKVKAEAMAQASGRTVTGVSSVEEHVSNDIARYSGTFDLAVESAAKGPGKSASVMPGEISVEASVTVKFNLQ